MIVRTKSDLLGRSEAVFSDCERYRYRLSRSWAGGDGWCNFLMLNPSTADEIVNDATVERCERRAREMGFAGLIVTNLFAFRATSPLDMKAQDDPIGPENDAAILAAARAARSVICAWGVHGAFRGRSAAVRDILTGIDLWALKVNLDGEPGHPLYVGYDVQPVRWNAELLK